MHLNFTRSMLKVAR